MAPHKKNFHLADEKGRTDPGFKIPAWRTIYLARHGAIQKPAQEKIYIGRSDLALSPQGHVQAKDLAEKLRSARLNAIYTSNLIRTIETAGYAARMHGLAPIQTPALEEINLGQWEGLSFESVQKRNPAAFAQRGRDIIHFRPPCGESFLDVALRVIPALYHIIDQTRGNILIVGHAGVNRIILAQAMGANLNNIFNIPMEYGSLYRIACHPHRFLFADAAPVT